MKSHALYLPALAVAAIGAAVVAFCFLEPLGDALVRPLTFIAVGAVTVLFVRMLFDANIRQGISAANIELRGGSFFQRPFDSKWGLFGSRMGGRPLRVIRTVCFAEFVVALLFSRHDGRDLLFLALASFGVTLMLTIIHVGLNTQAQRL
jgi:hypothetical protein